MQPRRVGHHGFAAALASLLVALGLVVVTGAPASADIAAIAPARAEVDPGGSASATVTVRASGLTCVNARPSDPALAPSFSTGCDDEPEWRTTLTVQAPTQPGTYSVRVTDDQSGEGGGRTFTLVVRQPPAPPTTTTPPATTTTAAPTATTTTAAPATTTTTAPSTTTTAGPTTTTSVVASTTTTAALTGDPFTPLAELVTDPVPTEGVFLPLVGEGYRDCLPLTTACIDPGSGLVLIPARTTELSWQPLAEGSSPAPRTDLRGIAPLQAVGVGPADPRTRNYALSVLDLTAPGGQLRTLVRSLDDQGRLGVVAADQPLLHAVVSGPSVDVGDSRAVASMPFGRPSIRTASSFTEAAPAVPMFASVEPQVVYAVRPDNGWGLNLDLVPLLDGGLPFLVRAIEGPPGLFIARPANLRIPQAEDAPAASPSTEDDGGGGGFPVALLGGVVVIGALATGALALLRRRRNAGAATPPPSTPRGTSR